MANRSFTRSFYTLHAAPVLIDCTVPIGATGAVGTITGSGVSSVTRLAAGTYKIQFQDNYYRLFSFFANLYSPSTGNTAVTAITPGNVYVIRTVGTTTTAGWVTAGVPAGITPAVGVPFVAAAVSTGSGTCFVPSISGLSSIELVGNPQLTLGPVGAANQGGYVVIQTLQPQQTGTTTSGTPVNLVATDPASGSILDLSFYLSNSSVLLQGE